MPSALCNQPAAPTEAHAADNAAVAADLARRGFRVFPITRKGHGNWTPETGWQTIASADAGTVAAWWRKWPEARVGLPCGPENGIAVLDVDEKNGKSGSATLAALGFPDVESLSPVRVRTPSGGWHLIFKHDDRLHNAVGEQRRGIGRALDIRTAGGFVVAPGSFKDGKRYEPVGAALGAVDLPEWPEALMPAAKPEYERAAPLTDATEAQRTWARRHLSNLADDLAATREGGRNDALNSAAMWAGGAGAHGFVTRADAEAGLVAAALACGLDRREAESAFDHGWSDGLDRPISDFPAAIDANALLDPEPDDVDGWGNPVNDNANDDGDSTAAAAPAARLRFRSPAECATSPSRGYVVKGMIAPGDVVSIFGAPGAGKSMLGPHIGYAVAQGRKVFGMRTRPGPVLYVAPEDPEGLAKRVDALMRLYGDAPDFQLVDRIGDLFASTAPDLTELIAAVKARRPVMVFVDTLAMAFPGLEENDAASMNRVVTIARRLAKWGAAVVLVHHSPKAADGTPRGHSSLNGALDAAIMLQKDDSGVVRGKLTKNRNGPCDRELVFRIVSEKLGTDEDGEAITAGRCEEVADGACLPAKRLSATQAAALRVLRALLSSGARSVPEAVWRDACIDGREVSGSDDRDNRRRVVTKAFGELARMHLVTFTGDRVYLAELAHGSSATADSLDDDDDDGDLIG